MLEFGRKNYFAEVTCQSEVRSGGKLRDDVGHTNKVHCTENGVCCRRVDVMRPSD